MYHLYRTLQVTQKSIVGLGKLADIQLVRHGIPPKSTNIRVDCGLNPRDEMAQSMAMTLMSAYVRTPISAQIADSSNHLVNSMKSDLERISREAKKQSAQKRRKKDNITPVQSMPASSLAFVRNSESPGIPVEGQSITTPSRSVLAVDVSANVSNLCVVNDTTPTDANLISNTSVSALPNFQDGPNAAMLHNRNVTVAPESPIQPNAQVNPSISPTSMQQSSGIMDSSVATYVPQLTEHVNISPLEPDDSRISADGYSKRRSRWTIEEIVKFEKACEMYGYSKPKLISEYIGTRTNEQVRERIRWVRRKVGIDPEKDRSMYKRREREKDRRTTFVAGSGHPPDTCAATQEASGPGTGSENRTSTDMYPMPPRLMPDAAPMDTTATGDNAAMFALLREQSQQTIGRPDSASAFSEVDRAISHESASANPQRNRTQSLPPHLTTVLQVLASPVGNQSVGYI